MKTKHDLKTRSMKSVYILINGFILFENKIRLDNQFNGNKIYLEIHFIMTKHDLIYCFMKTNLNWIFGMKHDLIIEFMKISLT